MRLDLLLSRFSALLLILAICIPRISLSGSAKGNGLRVEDVVLALALLCSFPRLFRVARKQTTVSGTFLLYGLFLLLQLIASLFSILRGDMTIPQTMVYTLKLAEFCVPAAIIAGISAGDRQIMAKYMPPFLFLSFIVFIVLDMIGENPFSRFGSDRGSGNTGGPYEAAVIASFLASYYMSRRNLAFYVLSVASLLFTQSRITVAAFAVLLRRHIPRAYAIAGPFFFLFFAGVVIAGGAILLPDSGIVKRFHGARAALTLKALVHEIEAVPTPYSRANYFDQVFGGTSSREEVKQSNDASTVIRMLRWTALLKLTLSEGSRFIFGSGPGYAGSAVDGGYVRLVMEGGVLGLCAYLAFFLRAYRRATDEAVREYILVLAITGIFIDIFFSMKAMILLWTLISLRAHQRVPAPRVSAPAPRPKPLVPAHPSSPQPPPLTQPPPQY